MRAPDAVSHWRPGPLDRVLGVLTRVEWSGAIFASAIALAYVVVPLAVYLAGLENEYFLQLAKLGAVGAACVLIGTRLPFFDRLNRSEDQKRVLGMEPFLAAVWGGFLVFVVLVCVTAERIPFVAALQGADRETISTLREQFLKAREGWQASFVYVNAALAGALVPYSLALLLLHRHRFRWLFFGFFLVYCISFVEKSFFLRAAIPLLYLTVQRRIASLIRPGLVLAGGLALLLLVTVASGIGTSDSDRGGDEYFSATYIPEGPLGMLGWRAVAIPVITAADALRVFEQEYSSTLLMGATSSLLAGTFGLERVKFERDVFAAQWGQNETETGSANSVFLTEAFVNFGWVGAVVFSLFVGVLFRIFARSQDEALRALWMIFAYALYAAPLIGILFSNGYALVLLLSMQFRCEPGAAPAPELPATPT
ncbi:hypothetical protein [Anaeromyxobacter diazotrophicus]|uniref:hypothetical protein n=1 Tax=Anaeromyxobacter diazotrophicus TaxID=2590199 RepID=UPI00159218DE|nr:hypothetical protein [Anaeromyxobacter diazotrophicus]